MTTFNEEKDHQEYVASIVTPGWDTVSDFWNTELGWVTGQVTHLWKPECDWLCKQEWPPTRQPEPCEVIHWLNFNKKLYRIQVGRDVPNYALPILFQEERNYIEESMKEACDYNKNMHRGQVKKELKGGIYEETMEESEWMLNPALVDQEYRVMGVSEKVHENDTGKKADERRTMYRIAKVEYKTAHNYDKHYWQNERKE